MKTLLRCVFLVFAVTFCWTLSIASARDLAEIQREGVLRHLGIPYANFILDDDNGLDIELMQLFAKELGVRYEFVRSSWVDVFGDLLGKEVKVQGEHVAITSSRAMKGDVIASGLTVLPWRKKVIDFSPATFPTQVWLVTPAASPLRPITPSGALTEDIKLTKALLAGKTVLGLAGTCLDLSLYRLEEVRATGKNFSGSLNDMAPAVLNGEADATLLDVPDVLVAMAKWPGQIKILGPVSEQQEMAVGFRKDSPELQKAFAKFYLGMKGDGRYGRLVGKHYPDIPYYYPNFFSGQEAAR